MKEKSIGKFKFNSQICTSHYQSERLLALGLKKETADMFHGAIHNGTKVVGYRVAPGYNDEHFEIFTDDIPAWSLHRLIEMIDDECIIHLKNFTASGVVCYKHESLFDNIIDCIERKIKEGYFNKEYLV